jgi:vacuolar-type H+-ATPase subunit H
LAAKREEAQILGAAREEARKITQQAAESAQQQQEKLKAQLEMEVEGLANAASEILLVRRT